MQNRKRSEEFRSLGTAELVQAEGGSVRLRADEATVEVTALAPDLFRVGMFLEGRPLTYRSEALAKTNWGTVETRHESADGTVRLATSHAAAHISLDPLRLAFETNGRCFAQDDAKRGMGFFPEVPVDDPVGQFIGPPVRLYKQHPTGEQYYACGEHTGGLNRTGSYQVFWNTDPLIGHNPSYLSLYTSIPFLLALQAGQAWGLFFANANRAQFDLAKEHPGLSWFGAAGGDLTYYLFTGPSVRDVLDRYTELTGRTPMPPLWSLGNQQSRYSYMDENEVREVAREFRERDIPCDAIYLDIDYMDGYRVFTWDPARFPDPQRLISDLKAEGFHTVTIVDPGVKVDDNYRVYREGRELDLYCKTPRGLEYHNVVWPGMCAFPDFTNSRAREWWGDQLPALLDPGVAGIWCDMDEPALFIPLHSTMPDNVVQPGDDDPHLHEQVHNLYGSEMAQATREGLLRHRPDERPLVISRAGFAGLQRHALHWTGDNSSWWEHLWMAMPQLQNLGLSGLAWVGVDVGGFFYDSNAELLARWAEFAIFQPFCRNHTGKGTRRQEPWAFGEPYESAIRSMLKLRQRLLPYLYTLFEECHRTGAPILRPLLFEYPEDEDTYYCDDEFLLGSGVLVAPIYRPGIEHRAVYLPGGPWFHLWSGEPQVGPSHILAHAPLGRPAVYVKGNMPLPLWPEMPYVGAQPADPLTILLFPAAGPEGSFTLYEDAGNGYAYERGEYARRRLTCGVSGATIGIRIGAREGSFSPTRQTIRLELHAVPAQPASVLANGEAASWEYDEAARTLAVTLAETSGAIDVEIVAPALPPDTARGLLIL